MNWKPILLDPLDTGDIYDNERHNITYGPAGTNPTLHSEDRRFKKAYSGGEENRPDLRQNVLNEGYIEDLSDELMLRTSVSRLQKSIAKAVERSRPIERVQYLLGRVYQVTWLLLP